MQIKKIMLIGFIGLHAELGGFCPSVIWNTVDSEQWTEKSDEDVNV
jgi:hypothetical protein